MPGKIFFAFMFLILSACARPNWAPPRSLDSVTQNDACTLKFKKSGLCIHWNWEIQPTESDVGSFIFKIYSLHPSDGSMVAAEITDDVNVELWMPDMNHGSSPVEVSKAAIGTYHANDVFFIMPGKWEIKFQIKNSGVIQDEAVTSVHF